MDHRVAGRPDLRVDGQAAVPADDRADDRAVGPAGGLCPDGESVPFALSTSRLSTTRM